MRGFGSIKELFVSRFCFWKEILSLMILIVSLYGIGHAENTLSYYKGVYDTEYTENKNDWDWIATCGTGNCYYNFHSVLDATVSMYEATGDTTYLARVLEWGSIMVDKATVTDNHGYKNWEGTLMTSYSSTPIASQLEDFQGSVELSRLVRIIWDDPTLKAAYWSPKGQKIYNFMVNNIIEKWLTNRGSNFDSDFDITQNPKQLDDKPVMCLRIINNLYHIGGNSTYGSKVTLWASKFRERITSYSGHPAVLIWDLGREALREGEYAGPDTAHGMRYPTAIIDMYRDGNSFTLSDVQGLAKLLTSVIWDQSTSSPRFTNYISGYNGTFRSADLWANGLIYAGWVNLGRYNETAQQVGHNTLVAILAGVRNPSLDAMNSYLGKAGLAANLAKNLLGQQKDTVPPAAPKLY